MGNTRSSCGLQKFQKAETVYSFEMLLTLPILQGVAVQRTTTEAWSLRKSKTSSTAPTNETKQKENKGK